MAENMWKFNMCITFIFIQAHGYLEVGLRHISFPFLRQRPPQSGAQGKFSHTNHHRYLYTVITIHSTPLLHVYIYIYTPKIHHTNHHEIHHETPEKSFSLFLAMARDKRVKSRSAVRLRRKERRCNTLTASGSQIHRENA